MSLRDLYIAGWNYGVDLEDGLSSLLESVVTRFNNYGLRAVRNNGSQPNALVLTQCVLANNQELGAALTRVGNFTMVGGSIEVNGAAGDDSIKGGLYITEGPSQAGNSIALYGVYIEGNTGSADIYFTSSASLPATLHFNGCSFQRISSTSYVTNNVFATGTDIMRFSFKGCSFKSLGSYSADAGRPYINISGAANATVDLDGSNYQEDAVESWTSPVTTAYGYSDASGRLQALPRSTTTALADVGDAINTTNKFADKAVINTTTGAIVTAAGATAASAWLALDGSTAHSPT